MGQQPGDLVNQERVAAGATVHPGPEPVVGPAAGDVGQQPGDLPRVEATQGQWPGLGGQPGQGAAAPGTRTGW
jgi:hypothetical protein